MVIVIVMERFMVVNVPIQFHAFTLFVLMCPVESLQKVYSYIMLKENECIVLTLLSIQLMIDCYCCFSVVSLTHYKV